MQDEAHGCFGACAGEWHLLLEAIEVPRRKPMLETILAEVAFQLRLMTLSERGILQFFSLPAII